MSDRPEYDGLVRVWLIHGANATYPEQEQAVSSVCPPTGVCFSGGGTRSYAASVGQLRGLAHLGLIPQVGYLSAVSGGAWAATAFAYYNGSGHSDTDILGPSADPEELSLDQLAWLDPGSLGYAATLDFAGILRATQAATAVTPQETWSRAIGQTFLAPYGLFDAAMPMAFTLTRETHDVILERNPALRGQRLHTVRGAQDRPFLLIQATLNWPADRLRDAHKVGFEFSPLYVGSPRLLVLESDTGETHRVGGGFVEPFAFGCAAPTSLPDRHGVVPVTLPARPFTLADAIGASSAFSTAAPDLQSYPRANCWPVTGRTDEATSAEVLTDGGDVENYGLVSLLRRRVSAIIVFINTVWPLSLEYDPTTWPDDDEDARRAIDPFLAPLFGGPSTRFPHNQVFAKSDFADVVSSLQAAKRTGQTVMAVCSHRVRANEWWGVAGGWDVRICWMYNERVGQWEHRLAPDIRRLIEEGRAAAGAGPVEHFPHYLTRGQNPGRLIQLTPTQVNLLAHLACWNVVSNEEIFRPLLSGGR